MKATVRIVAALLALCVIGCAGPTLVSDTIILEPETIMSREKHSYALSGVDVWADPNTQEPTGTRYKTFHSKTAGEDVFYLIATPPGYDAAQDKRYPVVYWLHGRGRSPRVGYYFVERALGAMASGAAPEMIVVLVNGRPGSMFCDSFDGAIPAESVIVKDLIPHIDATYRTVASREGRAVEGSSMGGFGALHLGLKFPELFGAVTSLSGAVFPDEGFERLGDTTPKKPGGPLRPNTLKIVFNADPDYIHANNPWNLIEANRRAICKSTNLRMIVGTEDKLIETNRDFHARLNDLGVPHSYTEVVGGLHAYYDLINRIDDERLFAFYREAFAGLDN